MFHHLNMQSRTKIQKRKAIKLNQELMALNALRSNEDLHDAINMWLLQPHLTEARRDRLRAVLAVLSHAPLKKLLAFL